MDDAARKPPSPSPWNVPTEKNCAPLSMWQSRAITTAALHRRRYIVSSFHRGFISLSPYVLSFRPTGSLASVGSRAKLLLFKHVFGSQQLAKMWQRFAILLISKTIENAIENYVVDGAAGARNSKAKHKIQIHTKFCPHRKWIHSMAAAATHIFYDF